MRVVALALLLALCACDGPRSSGRDGSDIRQDAVEFSAPEPQGCIVDDTSSFVREFCYSARAGALSIRLNSKWYTYCGVPTEVADGLAAAGSRGSFYNDYIKGRFPCAR